MDNKNKLKKATVSGLFYRFGERILAQLVSTIITIVLARLLLPEDYGIVSLVAIIITICNVFVTDGLSSSLIQKKDADDLDFSTIFWSSIGLAVVLYFIVFLGAPVIADFYEEELIIPVLRVLALKIPLAAVNSIQSAYVSKKLMFKKFFWATLIGTISSGVIGISLAYLGFGVWALVAQYLTNSFMDTVFLCFIVKWRPQFKFSFNRFKTLFAFGWKVLLSGLIGELYEELRSLIIAKRYSTADLSYYTKAKQFPQLLGNNVSSTITLVMFPVFSECQDDKALLKKAVRRSMTIGSYVLFPLLIGFASIGDSFVRLILTEKWLPSVPFIYVFSVMYVLKPLKNINKSAIKALKRSDLDLIVNIIEKIIGISLIFVFMNMGTMWLAIGALIAYLIAALANAFVCGRLINYNFKEQIIDILPYFILACVACIPAFLLNFVSINLILKLAIQIMTAVLIYIGVSFIFKIEPFKYLINTVKKAINKGNPKKKSGDDK